MIVVTSIQNIGSTLSSPIYFDAALLILLQNYMRELLTRS